MNMLAIHTFTAEFQRLARIRQRSRMSIDGKFRNQTDHRLKPAGKNNKGVDIAGRCEFDYSQIKLFFKRSVKMRKIDLFDSGNFGNPTVGMIRNNADNSGIQHSGFDIIYQFGKSRTAAVLTAGNKNNYFWTFKLSHDFFLSSQRTPSVAPS